MILLLLSRIEHCIHHRKATVELKAKLGDPQQLRRSTLGTFPLTGDERRHQVLKISNAIEPLDNLRPIQSNRKVPWIMINESLSGGFQKVSTS